ncbi:transcription initiation factor TFIID subunit 1-like [Mya arenaria]|uniref:transcription initiation factor TFIID subunit 1-like n=1 Tax=Mya arenaria TaxID=6604 RepID=UPI0022E57915|nr:transcription initiation factor TFIID subunit 1-like [Mya arenaria]
MAFFCPSGLGRAKHRKGYNSMIGRYETSDVIDDMTLGDLVKLSYETPASRRIVLHSFSACAPQEVSVKQGQKVNFIFREGEWAYVATDDKKEGFVPFHCCAKLGAQNQPCDRKEPNLSHEIKNDSLKHLVLNNRFNGINGSAKRVFSVESDETRSSTTSDVADDVDNEVYASTECSYDSEADDTSDVTVQERLMSKVTSQSGHPLRDLRSTSKADKQPSLLHQTSRSTSRNRSARCNDTEKGIYKVLFDYRGGDEYDVKVEADDIILLLDSRDPDWSWVQKPDGSQGYVPANYIQKFDFDETRVRRANKEHERTKPNNGVSHLPDDKIHLGAEMDEVNESSIDNLKCIPPSHPDTVKGMTTARNENSITKAIHMNIYVPDTGQVDRTRGTGLLTNADVKQKPKKPPRKKKHDPNLTPRSEISVDSIDTSMDSLADLDDLEVSSRVHTPTEMSSACSTPRHNKHHSSRRQGLGEQDTQEHIADEQVRQHRYEHIANEQVRQHRHEHIANKQVRQHRHEHIANEQVRQHRHEHIANEQVRQHRHEHIAKEQVRQHRHEHIHITDERMHQHRHEHKEGDRMHKHTHEHKEGDRMRQHTHASRKNENDHEGNHVNANADLRNRRNHKHSTISRGQSVDSSSSQRRPVSMPIFRSYEEYQKDYYDQYFYDEKDNRFGRKTSSNVVNVAEIMKIRSEKEQERAKTFASNKTTNPKEIKKVPNVKDFLLNIPSTRLELKTPKSHGHQNEVVKAIDKDHLHNNHDTRNTSRVTNDSKIEIAKATNGLFNQTNSSVNNRDMHYNSTNDVRTNSAFGEFELRPRSNSQSCAQHEGASADGAAARQDWSFGYPRKSKHKSDSAEVYVQEKQCNKNSSTHEKIEDTINLTKDDIEINPSPFENAQGITDVLRYLDEVCDIDNDDDEEDDDIFFDEDEEMERLLKQSGYLLDKTDDLLNTNNDVVKVSAIELDGECDDSLISLDANDKCSRFLNNQSIGIYGIETKNTNDVERSISPIVNGTETEHEYRNRVKPDENTKFDHYKEEKSKCKPPVSDIRGITEFISQCDYKAEAEDELPFRQGEILHVGLEGQESEHWYWTYSPRLRKYGFVPRAHVKIPLVTII